MKMPKVRIDEQPLVKVWRRAVLAVLGCLSLVAPMSSLAASAAAQQQLDRIEQDVTFVESLRDTVDRRQFDLEALMDGLDWEVASIQKFVQQEVTFEQYPGALRGALGTLLSRSGNSLDQALLLATLARDAGVEARILRGRLSEADAQRLLNGMSSQSQLPPAADQERWDALVSGNSNLAQSVESPPSQSADIDQSLNITKALAALLDQHGGVRGVSAASLIEEAKDYFWVELKSQSAGPWTPVHPAFGDAAENIKPQVQTVYAKTVPQELLHKLRLSVFIERRELGALKVEQVMADWQRPVANMLGKSFAYYTQPNLANEKILESDVAQAVANSRLFVPVFNNAVQPGTKGFDLNGVTYDLDIVGGGVDGATGFFQQLGETADKATAALDALGSNKPAAKRARYLTALWIEYTLVAPDGSETTTRRYLLDRIGAAVRVQGGADKLSLNQAEPWQILARDEFMLAAGRYPEALALDEILARTHAAFGLQAKLGSSGALAAQDYVAANQQSRGKSSAVLLQLLRQFDEGIGAAQSAPTYRSAPTLLALHWEPSDVNRGRFSTDIISHERRSLNWKNARTAARDLMLHGAWETVQESNALTLLDIPAGDIESAAVGFESKSGQQGSRPLRLVRSASDLTVISMHADHKEVVRGALDAGYYAALAQGTQDANFTWWRIDPHSGAALGMLADGRGATATEYAVGLTLVAIGMLGVFTLHELGECLFEPNLPGSQQRPMECCMIDKFTPDASLVETLAFKWAIATDHMRGKVGMAEEWCMGDQNNP